MTKIGIEAIQIPGGLFNEASFRRMLSNVRTARAKDIKVDFDTTTQTWNKRPEVQIKLIGDAEAEIFITDDRYTFVNDGSRPHPILPRVASRLVFQANYRAKTVVGTIGSQAGGKYGPTVYSLGVQHPGTKARKFDQLIADKWNALLPGIIDRAILAELG